MHAQYSENHYNNPGSIPGFLRPLHRIQERASGISLEKKIMLMMMKFEKISSLKLVD